MVINIHKELLQSESSGFNHLNRIFYVFFFSGDLRLTKDGSQGVAVWFLCTACSRSYVAGRWVLKKIEGRIVTVVFYDYYFQFFFLNFGSEIYCNIKILKSEKNWNNCNTKRYRFPYQAFSNSKVRLFFCHANVAIFEFQIVYPQEWLSLVYW